MMFRSTMTMAAVCIGLLISACAGSSPDDFPTSDSSGVPVATCLEGTSDCVDGDLSGQPGDDPILDGRIDDEAVLEDARSLLGEPEQEVLDLWAETRLGRRGQQHMALTEDYVLGRMTIATDNDGSGTFRVVEVTVELRDGPVTLTR